MYQALYRKYRPRTFSDVVGQKSVTDTLRAQLDTGRLSHAYLFTGTRGTGKTSCAKILAKAVNCENLQHGDPCGVCPACRAIDEGSCMDVMEIDAASNNGVDSVRALRDEAVYTPSEVKYRVYIIDEVHMLSLAAFNALLKIIEEPPAHLLFSLATTELQKVPATILSRCQRFSFKRLSVEDIAARLNYIAYEEHIEIEPAAIRLLARLADGALRDGVSLLDQCAAAEAQAVTLESVYASLGLAGLRQTAELMQAVADHDAARALTCFSALYAAGKDVGALLGEISTLCRDLLILKTAPSSGISMLSGIASDEQAAGLAKALSSGELMWILAQTQSTRASFVKNTDVRVAAELLLMQLCEPQLRADVPALAARISRLEDRLAAGLPVQPQQPSPAAEPKAAEPAPEPEPQPAEIPPELPEAQEDEPQRNFWPELSEKLRDDLPVRERGFFAPNGPIRPVLRGDRLFMAADTDFVLGMVKRPEVERLVREKAAAVLGRRVEVRFVLKNQLSGTADDPMDALVRFGEQHSDIFTIK